MHLEQLGTFRCAESGQHGVSYDQWVLALHDRGAEATTGSAEYPTLNALGRWQSYRACDAALAVSDEVDLFGVDPEIGIGLREVTPLAHLASHKFDSSDGVEGTLPEGSATGLGVEVVEGIQPLEGRIAVGPAVTVKRLGDADRHKTTARGEEAGAQVAASEVTESIAGRAVGVDDHGPALLGLGLRRSGSPNYEGNTLFGHAYRHPVLELEAAAFARIRSDAALEVSREVVAIVDVVFSLEVFMLRVQERQLPLPAWIVAVAADELREHLHLRGGVLGSEDRGTGDPLSRADLIRALIACLYRVGQGAQGLGKGLVDVLQRGILGVPLKQLSEKGRGLQEGTVGIADVSEDDGVASRFGEGKAPVGSDHHMICTQVGVAVVATKFPARRYAASVSG